MKKLNSKLLVSVGISAFLIFQSCTKDAKPTAQNSPIQETTDFVVNEMDATDNKVQPEKDSEKQVVQTTTPVIHNTNENTNRDKIASKEYLSDSKAEDYFGKASTAEPAYGGVYNKREVAQCQPILNNYPQEQGYIEHNTEEYDVVNENKFLTAVENPLSTFSIDVDNASYTNTRRFINNGSLPPKDAVRIEEFINYFNYDYAEPKGEHPFSLNTEIGTAPWNSKHRLVHIGLQGKKYAFDEIEPMNLVFLIDVSGSMSSANKLPLLKKSYEMLVQKLRPQDNIAIVVYAGAAGMVLPSTSGKDKTTILNAINNLQAGGSTAGGQGIILAYKIAQENFKENGVNRVILATDGDFNIGASSNAEMTRLIEEKRETGIFLTVLGFGMGNYKDSKMETVADNGNGNYFYIDNIQESNKVLVDELGSTLYTIAKDVKLQVEFNPAKVQAYRLIGYENRMLKKEDFNDDKKDAGELGAGHTVTALYEIIPVGVESSFLKSVDALKYQIPTSPSKTDFNDELLTIKFRYKEPDGATSKLIVHSLKDSKATTHSNNFNFSAAVAGFGMLLRDSEYKQNLSFDDVITLANNSKGLDSEGYRAEFVKLVKTAKSLGGLAVK